MDDIERYENAINSMEYDIQYEEYQIRIRNNGINRILKKLDVSNQKKKQKLLKILSKLLAAQYLSESYIRHTRSFQVGAKINQQLLAGTLSLEEADNLKKNNHNPNDTWEVEYQCQLASLLDPSTLENRKTASKKIQYIRDLKLKIIKGEK